MEFQTRDIEPVLCWHPVTVMTFTRFRQVLVILVQFMTFISTDIEIWTWQPCLHLTWSFSLSIPISKILSTFYSHPSKPAQHWSKQGMKNTKIPGVHSATPLSLTWHKDHHCFWWFCRFKKLILPEHPSNVKHYQWALCLRCSSVWGPSLSTVHRI